MSIDNRLENAHNIIRWTAETYPGQTYVMSSFGAESALLLDIVEASGVKLPVLTVDTGFLFDATSDFRNELRERYEFPLVSVGPSHEDINTIANQELWRSDIKLYNKITKVGPLERAIHELGILALISGVRADQTIHRSSLNVTGQGLQNELRVHPVLDWSQVEVETYFNENNLPRHPLYKQGYYSIGDWTTTEPGRGREGRLLGTNKECGLHVVEDRLSRVIGETAA